MGHSTICTTSDFISSFLYFDMLLDSITPFLLLCDFEASVLVLEVYGFSFYFCEYILESQNPICGRLGFGLIILLHNPRVS